VEFVWLVVGLLFAGRVILFPVETGSIPRQEDLAVYVVKPALTSCSSPLRGFFLWMTEEMLNIGLLSSLFLFYVFFFFLFLSLQGILVGKDKWKRQRTEGSL